MQFTILQENLQQVILDVQKSITARPPLPILSCILMKTDDNKISFSATDLQIGIRSQAEAEIEKPGVCAVPAKVFIDYINTLSPGKLTISLDGQTLTVKAKGDKATFQCFAPGDYPPFPEKEGDGVELSLKFFEPAVQNTSFAASMDEARPVLTTLLFNLGEKTEVVGTDGFRLARYVSNFHLSPPRPLLLPAKAVNEVLRIAQRKKVKSVFFRLSEKLKQVFFSFADVEMLVRVIDGDFPPYQKIMPVDFQTEVSFDGDEFAQKIKTAMIFARESSGIIRLRVEKEELKIISSSSTLGTQEGVLPLTLIKGGDQEIA